jgi:hypothetical protein
MKDYTGTQLLRGGIRLTTKLDLLGSRVDITAINRALIFDTETYTELPQNARILTFTIIDIAEAMLNPKATEFKRRGIVAYSLDRVEATTLLEFAKENDIEVFTKQQFIEDVFYPRVSKGYYVVGHNVRFDIGAIAQSFIVDEYEKCFKLKICFCPGDTCKKHPSIIVKPLKTNKDLMYFDIDGYGPIVDTRILGNAILGNGKGSLNAMLKRYGLTDEKKDEITSYSAKYTKEMYKYAIHDAELTGMLFAAICKLYAQHDLVTPLYMLFSEASVGKGYLNKFGVIPFKNAQPHISREIYKYANDAMYGGRSEVNMKLRDFRYPVQVRYCDFKSQYPLVNALLNTQRFLLAKRVEVLRNQQDNITEIIKKIKFEDLRDRNIWKEFCGILCKVKPNNDILPHRIQLSDGTKIYETSPVSGGEKWYSICDVIASYIRTGKIPEIIDGIVLVPSEEKRQTSIIKLFGDDNFVIDLSRDDLFIKIIDYRDKVKADKKTLEKSVKTDKDLVLVHEKQLQIENLSNFQNVLKLISNSTSYGILVESREEAREDVAGSFNALPIGIHITAGARLLLACAEKLGMDRCIKHAFCDTDSFAYALPEIDKNIIKEEKDKKVNEFYEKVDECVSWFNTLNPYSSSGSIFELEEYNFKEVYSEEQGKMIKVNEPLYVLGVGVKRYVLFNINNGNEIVIRKYSEHGVTKYNIDMDIKLPCDISAIPTDYSGFKLFSTDMYCMWYRGIEAILNDKFPTVPVEEWSEQIAIRQVTISTPRMYLAHQRIKNIRPFAFFCVTPNSLNSKNRRRYYMPYAKNSKEVMEHVRDGKVKDIITNEVESNPVFEKIYERYAEFFLHDDGKSCNGDFITTRQVAEITDTQYTTRTGKKIFDSDLEYVQEELF